MSPPRADDMVNLGLRVWGTPANFNGFHVLATLLHATSSGRQPNFSALNRGRHLYSAGWPSHWALAHISSSVFFSLTERLLNLIHPFCHYRMQWTAEGSVFGAVSLRFLFVYEISRELLNGFAPNSHGRHVWSLAQTSLKVRVKGQGHQGQKMAFFGPFGVLCVVYVW